MDVDKLINDVFQRPSSIWDERKKEYANRNVVDREWKEICMEMNTEDGVLRKKWKNLRDYFGTEHSKRHMTRSPTWTSKWKYFEQLLFLKDIVAPRKCSGSLSGIINNANDRVEDSEHGFRVLEPTSTSPTQNESETIDHELEVLNVTGDTDSRMSVATSPTSTPTDPIKPPGGKREKGRRTIDTNNRSKSNENDDNGMLFLKSLHPFVKKVPLDRKMAFRSRMQMLVDEFSYGAGNSHNETFFSSQHYGQGTSAASTHSSIDRPYMPCPAVDTYKSYHTSNYNE